jgi:hypothetical protein
MLKDPAYALEEFRTLAEWASLKKRGEKELKLKNINVRKYKESGKKSLCSNC